ncbi:MAG: class I SAM-dependent methyltransferase [Ruminiclostridium sp.]
MDLRQTFNEDVLNYDKMRPTYVKELYDDIIKFTGLDLNKKALEIGIGTGQATAPFLSTGCKVTAIELGKDLAEFSKEKFSKYKNFDIVNNDFESTTFEEKFFDLIYSATAFHWIPQDVGYTKAFQLLKSNGVLALFWNHPSVPEDKLHFEMQKVYDKYWSPSDKKSTVHKFSVDNCLDIVRTINQYGFTDVNYKLYHQVRLFDAESYISLLNTYSDHRALQEDKRKLLEIDMIDVINNNGGQVDIHDTMDLYLARKQ